MEKGRMGDLGLDRKYNIKMDLKGTEWECRLK
jgi:hypothetical protein